MIFSSLGISAYAPLYQEELYKAISIYVSLLLIWRFNPYRSQILSTLSIKEQNNNFSLDRKISFHAGIFILTTTVLVNVLQQVKIYIKDSNSILSYFKTQ